MYSVFSALTWRAIPPTTRSRHCSKYSIWVVVFARRVMSSAWSASVIDCAEYLMFLSFVCLKPFSYISLSERNCFVLRKAPKRFKRQ